MPLPTSRVEEHSLPGCPGRLLVQRRAGRARGVPLRVAPAGPATTTLGFRLARGRASGGQQGPEGPSRTRFVVTSAPSGDGRSPSGAVPERRTPATDIPGPVAVDPHWQEDQDEFGVYADVRIPETQVGFRMRRIDPGTFVMGSPDDDPEALD